MHQTKRRLKGERKRTSCSCKNRSKWRTTKAKSEETKQWYRSWITHTRTHAHTRTSISQQHNIDKRWNSQFKTWLKWTYREKRSGSCPKRAREDNLPKKERNNNSNSKSNTESNSESARKHLSVEQNDSPDTTAQTNNEIEIISDPHHDQLKNTKT